MAGSTVKIHRSRALSFKKLSFLYLVFIVFYFFSTSGEYIKHYHSLYKTQETLNNKYLSELNSIECKKLSDFTLRDQSLELFNTIEANKSELNNFLGNKLAFEEKSKETKFCKKFVQNGGYDQLKSKILNYVSLFPSYYQNELLTQFGLDIQGKNPLVTELPNGYLLNVFNYFQTVVLKSAIQELKINQLPKKLVTQKEQVIEETKPSNKNPFLQSLRSVYYIGENVDFSIFCSDSVQPQLIVNNDYLQLKKERNSIYHANWTPNKIGQYKITVSNSTHTQTQDVEVKSLKLNFLENLQEVVCNMNESFTLTPYLSNGLKINDLEFKSNEAIISIEENHLNITPIVEGRFNINVKLGSKEIENLSLFSKINSLPKVILNDKYNQVTNFTNAFALNTTLSNWQVTEFNMVLVLADGTKKTFHSNNKYLSNEMLDNQKSLTEGASIVFEQVKLLYKDGVKTTIGRPLYIKK